MYKLVLLPFFTLIAGFLFGPSPNQSIPKHQRGTQSYPEHLTGAFTGGFGEETCRSCHFDYDLNPDGGSLSVAGIPKTIDAGQSLTITITVDRKKLGKGGFQLSARYPDGRQAGRFEIEGNSRIMATSSIPDSLQYVQHSKAGTKPTAQSEARWQINWKAPKTVSDTIIFNIAVNAANGDQSEFGDFIYAQEITVAHRDGKK
ncbi:choice-of-anchor V domain-containing protein [Fodinibius salsisoli]|uniref:Reelin domain-containing protein n=1 Tax=Fodinibius salsisoli TaxID=2820877 RepID=A0ABT3PI73_9BACT|nr:choice-of-anchor V domain-containing protein [Fodinibius salsisoli]MCW9705636.1 hypothetical protein [Fodinibius salsisoli]